MTDFYCCSQFAQFLTEEDFNVKEIEEILDFNHCPFCGYKLKMLQ